MRGDDDKDLPSPSTMLTPVPGRWITLVCPVQVPEKIGVVKVTKARLIAIVNGFSPGEKVYLDGIELNRIPDALAPEADHLRNTPSSDVPQGNRMW
jgi:hypothetical protein